MFLSLVTIGSLPVPSTAQPFGAFVVLTGANGYVEVPNSAAISVAGEMTIEAWVNITPSGGCRSLVGKNFASSYWIGVCGTTIRSQSSGPTTAREGGAVEDARWTHIAVVFGNGLRKHYVNGEERASFAETVPLGVSSSPLRIGSDVSWAFTPTGCIDELRLWNVARTKAQIRSTINTTVHSPTPGLVSVWAFDGAGNDLVGGQNGTGVGQYSFQFPPAVGHCDPGPHVLCLQNRFAVAVEWRDFAGNVGDATVASCGTSDSGLYWFFSPQNVEMLVKVLNGCTFNDRYWIFAAATTNVGFRLEVLDVQRNDSRIYFNYLGESAPAVTDAAALQTCP
ncbi:MAG: LamG domain-containing protein [Acidobacteriota bacterium]